MWPASCQCRNIQRMIARCRYFLPEFDSWLFFKCTFFHLLFWRLNVQGLLYWTMLPMKSNAEKTWGSVSLFFGILPFTCSTDRQIFSVLSFYCWDKACLLVSAWRLRYGREAPKTPRMVILDSWQDLVLHIHTLKLCVCGGWVCQTVGCCWSS